MQKFNSVLCRWSSIFEHLFSNCLKLQWEWTKGLSVQSKDCYSTPHNVIKFQALKVHLHLLSHGRCNSHRPISHISDFSHPNASLIHAKLLCLRSLITYPVLCCCASARLTAHLAQHYKQGCLSSGSLILPPTHQAHLAIYCCNCLEASFSIGERLRQWCEAV